ncbi:MAG: dTDP-4-dehydrorhamnose reductase, partial [Pseudomonadota bacterium]
MKVLVTGSDGQVGHCLGRELHASNWQSQLCNRAALDITQREQVRQAVLDYAPDLIINAAAYTAVDKAESEPEAAHDVNAKGAENLALAATAAGAALFHISTDYVFDGTLDAAYTESADVSPCGVYGLSKLEGERAVRRHCARHIIMRTSWVFCEHGANFVKTMMRLGAQGNRIRVVSDQYGGPTYAGDIAKALVAIGDKLEQVIDQGDGDTFPWGLYHYSGMPYVSWFDFAQSIFAHASQPKQVSRMKPLLLSHPDQGLVNYVLSGLSDGFSIGFQGRRD